jgi:hypothetical protein
MNSDEQFFKRADKQMLNQLWQGYVIVPTQNKIRTLGNKFLGVFLCY